VGFLLLVEHVIIADLDQPVVNEALLVTSQIIDRSDRQDSLADLQGAAVQVPGTLKPSVGVALPFQPFEVEFDASIDVL
jgi:hypothetical protein